MKIQRFSGSIVVYGNSICFIAEVINDAGEEKIGIGGQYERRVYSNLESLAITDFSEFRNRL